MYKSPLQEVGYTFDYEDVQLIPKMCIVESRSQCDTQVKLGVLSFKMPVVPANMTTIIDEALAVSLAKNEYFYIMHRFEIDALEFTKSMHAKGLFASISVGVQMQHYELIESFAKENISPEYITIDIAHGHSLSVKKMIGHIKKLLPQSFLIAGNVGTPEALKDLEKWGADATKLGIGPGKVCTTKLKTGFGTGGWQLSALSWCASVATKPIIADGGIRYHCDIAKSIAFGASMCMIGSLFAGHDENPGEIIVIDNKKQKAYFGSASEFNKNERKNLEGKKIFIEHKGSVNDTLKEMQEDLQSAISYAGGKNLDALRASNYVVVKNSIFNGDS